MCVVQLVPEQGEKPAEHGDLKDMCDEHAEEMVRKVNMQPVSTRTSTLYYLHYTQSTINV